MLQKHINFLKMIKEDYLDYFSRNTHTEKKAVKMLILRLKRGESVALFGKNGAGKSTITKNDNRCMLSN